MKFNRNALLAFLAAVIAVATVLTQLVQSLPESPAPVPTVDAGVATPVVVVDPATPVGDAGVK